MFTELFCNCFVYPATYEGIKLGTGKIWKMIADAKNEKKLSSTDISLYNLIEEVCRKQVKNGSDDKLYSGCEILCSAWLRNTRFTESDIRLALNEMGEPLPKSTKIDSFKKLLEEEISKNQELTNTAILNKLEQIIASLPKESESIFETEAKTVYPTLNNIDTEIPPKYFTNIGKEHTVYSHYTTKNGLRIRINFEPTRIRPDFPDFGGLYYRFSPPYSIVSKKYLKVFLEFLDENIRHITLELKKTGHKHPDDEMKYVIKNLQNGCREYIFDLDKCPHNIKEELGEIVLSTSATDFADENYLCSEICISQIIFE